MKKKNWMSALYGFIVGAAMIVPGVSGGSMAMILGIYDRLIFAVSSFGKNAKENLLFLMTFVFSAGVGIFLLSGPLTWLLENYGMMTRYFFLGTVFGGIPFMEKKSGIQRISPGVILYMLAGAAFVFLVSMIPEDIFAVSIWQNDFSWIRLILAGVISSIALILPGISFSHFLLILGLYESLLGAIRHMGIGFLCCLGLGMALGIEFFIKILEALMRKYPKQTYLIIMGFVFASLGELFPGLPKGLNGILCPGMALAGFFSIWWLTRKELEN